MNNIPFDNCDRREMAQYLGREVCFVGQITRTSAPKPNERYVCVNNVVVAPRQDNVPFRERKHIKFQHIWLDVSEVSEYRPRVADDVLGSGTVIQYKRKDGSTSYCIKFIEKGLTETGLWREFTKRIEYARLQTTHLDVATQHELVESIFKETVELVLSGTVCFFDLTPELFIKQMYHHRGDIRRACGVVLPNNRSGRRFHRSHRPSKRCRPTPSVKGFG